MAFKAFVVLVALCLVSLASGFVAPTAFARNGEWGVCFLFMSFDLGGPWQPSSRFTHVCHRAAEVRTVAGRRAALLTLSGFPVPLFTPPLVVLTAGVQYVFARCVSTGSA